MACYRDSISAITNKVKNERGRRNMWSRNEDEGTSGIQKKI
jgi:hypothetical protein